MYITISLCNITTVQYYKYPLDATKFTQNAELCELKHRFNLEATSDTFSNNYLKRLPFEKKIYEV